MTSSIERRRSAVPQPVRLYGWLGVLPFAGCAATAVAAPEEQAALACSLLLAYGALILSFLGGIRWGYAIAEGDPDARSLGEGVTPALVGWTAFFLPVPAGLSVLALGFAVALASDRRAGLRFRLPAWYPAIRTPLTAAAVIALLVPVGIATG